MNHLDKFLQDYRLIKTLSYIHIRYGYSSRHPSYIFYFIYRDFYFFEKKKIAIITTIA